jgi:hypothetical protein
MKKSKKTTSKGKKKSSAPKKPKPILAVMAPERIFRLDMEIAIHDMGTGATTYSWAERTARKGVGEGMALALAEDLKRCGVGGRLVHLDGTPEGVLIEEWFGVERMESARKTEEPSLKSS